LSTVDNNEPSKFQNCRDSKVLKQPSPSKTLSEDLSLMNLSLSSLLSETFAEFAVNGDSGITGKGHKIQ
jgi:hypothetical protein